MNVLLKNIFNLSSLLCASEAFLKLSVYSSIFMVLQVEARINYDLYGS